MTGFLRSAATICIATAVFAGVVEAQTSGISPVTDCLLAQAPGDQAGPRLQALQVAIDSKDTTAIGNLLSEQPRNQRGPTATLLLSAAQFLVATDKQFAATLAALAFVSGGLTPAQANNALVAIRNVPGGLTAVANLLSATPTGGFALANADTVAGLFNLIVAENKYQTQASPN